MRFLMRIKWNSSSIFTVGYMCFLIGYIISASQIAKLYVLLMTIRSFLRIIGYVCCLYGIITCKLTVFRLTIILFLISSALLSRIITGMDYLFVDFFLIAAVQGVDKRKLIATELVVRITCLALLYLTVRLGIISDYVGYRDGVPVRFSWGFNHPNRLGLHLLAISLDIFFLYHGKLKAIHWSGLAILALIANFVADSRAPFFCIIMVFMAEITCIVCRKIKDNKKGAKLKFMSYFLLSSCVFISFIVPYLFNNGFLIVEGESNTIGSRIIKASYALNNFSIPFWSQKLENIGIMEAIEKGIIATGIDNLYVHLILNFGIVFFVIFIGLFFCTIYHLYKTNNNVAMICFLIFIIFGVVENTAYVIECNLFLLYIGEAILDKKQIDYVYHNT